MSISFSESVPWGNIAYIFGKCRLLFLFFRRGDIEWNARLVDADAENDADKNADVDADEDVADADERGKVKKSTHDSEMNRRRVKISVLGFFFVGFWVGLCLGLWTVVIILGCGATYFSEPI